MSYNISEIILSVFTLMSSNFAMATETTLKGSCDDQSYEAVCIEYYGADFANPELMKAECKKGSGRGVVTANACPKNLGLGCVVNELQSNEHIIFGADGITRKFLPLVCDS